MVVEPGRGGATPVRIVFSTDEITDVSDRIVGHLQGQGHVVEVVRAGEPWPEVGRSVGETVAANEADVGVVCCWTGTGVALAANKVAGVRAALCTDPETARGARRWNDANVLALGLRLTSGPMAEEIVDAFLTTAVDPSEVATIARMSAPDPGPVASIARVSDVDRGEVAAPASVSATATGLM